MLCQRVKLLEDRALYEAWTIGSPLIFQLECPDIGLSRPILGKLDPGGTVGGGFDKFDLDILNLGGSVEHTNTLVVHAHNFSK